MKKVNNKYSRFISIWLKKLISLFGNIISNMILNIIKITISILNAICVTTKKLATEHSHMVIGAFLGLTVSTLLSHIPVLGWLIGAIATLFIVLLGAYFGHRGRNSNNNLVSFFNIFVDYIYQIIVAILQKYYSDSTTSIHRIGYSPG